MPLKDEIDQRSAEIHTDGYPMSIGELMSLYENKEMDIHPEFQRFFRWTPAQKSRLIESILLGIPVPSIFVAQREDGVWDVIDGLQRLATIFQFAGILRDERDGVLHPLVLEGTKYLPSLAGKRWEGSGGDTLDQAQRLLIKRAKLDIKIVLRTSTPSSKFELFQRLNTGGSILSDQEVRNCILISIDPDSYRWLRSLAKLPVFANCLNLSDRLVDEQYDLELALRFLMLRDADQSALRGIGDIGEFLTDKSTSLAQSHSLKIEQAEQAFVRTFTRINTALYDDAFRRYESCSGRFLGPFLISAFEAISLGVCDNLDDWESRSSDELLLQKVKELWAQEAFTTAIGSGIRASQRIPVIIPFGRDFFKP